MRIDINHHYYEKEENILMTISAGVQAILDQVKINTSLEQSAALALEALSKQAADQGAQISALQAQVAAGGTIGADDLAALATSNSDLVASASRLKVDIPANATPAPVPVPTPAP